MNDATGTHETLVPDLNHSLELRHPNRWTWTNPIRRKLSAASDRELFDFCNSGGLRLDPFLLLDHMDEASYSLRGEIKSPAEWGAAMVGVRDHGRRGHADDSIRFCEEVDRHFALLGEQAGTQEGLGVRVDIVDHDGRCDWSIPHGRLIDVLYVLGLLVPLPELSRLEYVYEGSAGYARLQLTGPEFEAHYELHVARDLKRALLAERHAETVLDGEEGAIAYLNRVTDEDCTRLLRLACRHPEADVWTLRQLLETRDD